MDIPEIYSRCSAAFADRVHLVGDRWNAPSGLPGWDVRTLVNHLVNEERWTPELFSGATIDSVGDRFDGDLLGDDPVSVFDQAAAIALQSICGQGAMERTVHLSFGDRPGSEYALQLSADHLVHAWDLARALGTDDALDPDIVEILLPWYTYETEELYHRIKVIGPRAETPPGAGAETELLARFGREQ
ncbi:TIGR03086 family metal-binding protein [Pseudonocardia sp. EC080619-01]|uniref:TIGR03086 family metal-binding protein n=2 Tax=unclassified Pseudonocardia TaxID=2619320 RepID=UPI000761E8D2|nr:TIGR03086 family metal-binding protein [Pseudonocardia sp. EC080619-01]